MLLSLVSLAEEELKGCRAPLPDPGARPSGEATPALLLNDMVLPVQREVQWSRMCCDLLLVSTQD